MSTCERVKHVLALCWELLSGKFAYELNMVDWRHFLLVGPFGNWELMKSFLSVSRETKEKLVDIISYLLPLWGYTPFRLVFSWSLKNFTTFDTTMKEKKNLPSIHHNNEPKKREKNITNAQIYMTCCSLFKYKSQYMRHVAKHTTWNQQHTTLKKQASTISFKHVTTKQ